MFRTVDFVAFLLVASGSVPNQDDHCPRCSVTLLVQEPSLEVAGDGAEHSTLGAFLTPSLPTPSTLEIFH